jgi:Yip1 domain.
MNNFFLTLFRPVKAFNQLKAESFSTMGFIVVLLLMLVNLILMIPVNEKILQITISSMTIPQNQLDMMVQVSHKMRYLQIAGTEIMYIIMFLFYAFLLHLTVRVFNSRLEYKKALQLIVCCYIVIVIGDLVNTALLYIRGLDAIEHIYDLSLTGINMLTSMEQVGATGYAFLSYINPFQLWFVALLSIGLRFFADIKPLKVIVISVLFWLITIMIPVLTVYYSQATLAKTGLM